MKSHCLPLGLGLSFILFGNAAFSQKESVNPGINNSYLKPDVEASQWIERFEREGREVYFNRHRIVEFIGLKPGMIVADIGTGTGAFLSEFVEKLGASGKVYAVDIVPDFLEHIDSRIKENDWRTVETLLCTERSVGLPANSIDVAYICDVYHHFEYPQDSLASIWRALKPNGEIILIDFERIPGTSSDWILNHMRAGQEIFEAEIQAAGFVKTEEIEGLLKDNYMVRFKKSEDC